MKIAMIGQKGIPSRSGGIEIHVEEIAKRLIRLGCVVDVYCRRSYCEDSLRQFEGINIKYAPFINSKHLDAITHTFTSTIKALLSGTDIFHYHALGPATLSFIPRLFGKKVVCTIHGLDWQRGKWGGFASKFLKFGEYASAKFSHKAINVSRNLVGYYFNKYGINTVFIPNGAELHEQIKPEIIDLKYNLKKNEYILFLARLVPEKGAHYLIQAYKSLKTNKKLVIAGGSSHSDQYEEELHRIAESDPNIIFTGFVTGKELDELYSNAYIYVLPSDVEGLPISLLEALSFGKCCLTSDIPENREVVEGVGYIFKKADINDLCIKIKYLLDNSELIYANKNKVQNYVLGKYDWDNITMKTYEVYKGTIS